MSKEVFATDAIKSGFQLFGKNWLMHILFVIGYFILFIIVQALINPRFKAAVIAIQSRFDSSVNHNEWIMILGQDTIPRELLSLLISVPFGMYFLGYFIRHAQNRFKGFAYLFKDIFTWKKIGNYFLAIILIFYTITFVGMISASLTASLVMLSNSPFETTIAFILFMTIAFILLMLFNLYFYSRLFFALFLVLDKGTDGIDAIEQSWKQTKGNEGQIILFFILSILLAILGLILFIVGLLFMVPVIFLAYSWFYVQLFDTEENLVATEDI